MHGDVRKALQEQSPELVSGGQWLEGALRVQTIASEMHRMQGVLIAINKSAMTDAEKLKATDAVANGMLATAKLGLAAMQQAEAIKNTRPVTPAPAPTPTPPTPKRVSPLGVPTQGGVVEKHPEPLAGIL